MTTEHLDVAIERLRLMEQAKHTLVGGLEWLRAMPLAMGIISAQQAQIAEMKRRLELARDALIDTCSTLPLAEQAGMLNLRQETVNCRRALAATDLARPLEE